MTGGRDLLTDLWRRYLGDEDASAEMLKHSPTRVVFGLGALTEVGALAKGEGASRVLLVTDEGIQSAGHVDRAVESLERAGLNVTVFDGVCENPTTEHVMAGVEVAQARSIDFIVVLGGGSAMDCAKGINLIVTNGGLVADYQGVNKASRPMLPSIAVPTTAGTGSEAQSFALICDPTTYEKMVCGDTRPPSEGGLRPRTAVLDPLLTASQPARVAAASGMDAIAHAVETAGTTKRHALSRSFSHAAWRLLSEAYEPAMCDPSDDDARARMLLGAHLAGIAIEQSMLGAAHACANPLTARVGIAHGVAVGLMLPHVVRFNAADGNNPYAELMGDAEELVHVIEGFLEAGHLPKRLAQCGVDSEILQQLARSAATQWTASFNPQPVDEAALLKIYRTAYS